MKNLTLLGFRVRFGHRLVVGLVSGLIFAAGLLTLARPLAERLPDRLIEVLQPFTSSQASFLFLAFGLVLMYLAYELLQRKRIAWWLAIVFTALNLILHIVIEPQLIPVVVAATALTGLVVSRSYFVSRIQTANIWQGIRLMVASVLLSLAYGSVGFWILDKRDFGLTFSFGQSITRTLQSFLLLGNNDLDADTRYGRWFLHSLAIVGAISLAYGLFSLFRPLRYRLHTLVYERQLAKNLLEKYGGETDDFFKLWPQDKSYFFGADNKAFVAYGVANGVALCFAGPVGAPASISKLLQEFKQYCLQNGWLIVFAQATNRFDKPLKTAGFNRLLIGADAVIDINNFVENTSRNKYFRNIKNRFERLGYSCHQYQPPHSPSLIREIGDVSRAWMSHGGRKQFRFFTGYFSNRYLQQTPLFIVRDNQGRLMAFVNRLPNFKSGEATIDLMRHRPEAPTNIMDFLFMNLMRELSKAGYRHFNMGLSPLAGRQFADRPTEKLLSYLYGSSQRLISFKGLHRYKAKFEPDWEPRYVYYQGAQIRLPQIGIAVAKLIKY